jgi:hypothetical protein
VPEPSSLILAISAFISGTMVFGARSVARRRRQSPVAWERSGGSRS